MLRRLTATQRVKRNIPRVYDNNATLRMCPEGNGIEKARIPGLCYAYLSPPLHTAYRPRHPFHYHPACALRVSPAPSSVDTRSGLPDAISFLADRSGSKTAN